MPLEHLEQLYQRIGSGTFDTHRHSLELTTLTSRALMRRLAMPVTTVLFAGCLDPLGAPPPPTSLNVLEENLRPGSTAWGAGLSVGADSDISGFGLPFSLQAEETLHVFVSAKTAVSVSIYRLGWYGGTGARLVAKHAFRPVRQQPPCSPAIPGPFACDWFETDRFVVDARWMPGVYLARVADSVQRARAFPFVVRSSRPAAFVVVLPFATYEAYNAWGGTSLYRGPGSTRAESYANRAVKVSFARPFTQMVVSGAFLGVDYLLVRWLEQNAYDVSYVSDYDFHNGVGPPVPPVAWLFAGHSEYWTWPMWLRANEARAQGVNLGFLGGNDVYWVARFETVRTSGLEAPVVVCYRDATHDPQGGIPGLATVLFRSPPNNSPENALVGVMSGHDKLIQGSPIDLTVANGSDPLFAGTGLKTGDHIPQVAGWEADRIVDNGATPPGVRVLFQSQYVALGDTGSGELLQSTIYAWPGSGALVYASGEPGFAWGLATYSQHVASPALQRFLQNVLEAFVAVRSNR